MTSLSDVVSDRPAWQRYGACVGLNPDLFFTARGERTEDAKAVCRGCPVRLQCLDYAIAHAMKFGIWGGLSERERRQIRRERNQNRRAS